MIIGGVDPGLVACGYAYVGVIGYGHDELAAAGIVRGDADLDPSARVVDIATRLAAVMPKCDVLFVECMTYRPQAKVNPKILLSLNLLAGSCMQLLAPGGQLFFVEPHVWKGTVDKDVHNSRVRVSLSPLERAILDAVKPKGLVHNAVDAVGLCLYATGRLTPKTKRIHTCR